MTTIWDIALCGLVEGQHENLKFHKVENWCNMQMFQYVPVFCPPY